MTNDQRTWECLVRLEAKVDLIEAKLNTRDGERKVFFWLLSTASGAVGSALTLAVTYFVKKP